MERKPDQALAVALGVLIGFAALANAAHDLWAATIVYIAVLCLAVIVLWTKAGREESQGVSMPLIGPALLIIMSFYLSFAHAANPGDSYMAFMDWVSAFLIFFIANQVFRTQGTFRFFLYCLIPVFYIEFGIHFQQNIPFLMKTTRVLPSGTLINANISAAFHLLWIPAFVVLMKDQFQKSQRFYFFLIVLSVLFFNLLLTYSVWAWVCLALAFPVLLGKRLLLMFKRNHAQLFWTLVGFLAIVVVGLVVLKMVQIFITGFDLSGRPSTNRLYWWASALTMFLAHPWLGVGIGNYPSAYLAFKVGPGFNTRSPHNFYAGLLGEAGILGFMSVLFFFSLWIWTVIRYQKNREQRTGAIGVFLLLMFITVSVGMEYLVNLLSCFLLMGVSLAGIPGSFWKPRKSALIVLSAGAVAALPFIMAPFIASQNVVAGLECLKGNKEYNKAIKYFTSAMDLDSRSYKAPWGLAKVYDRMFLNAGDPADLDRALNFQKEALKRNKYSGLLWWELSVYHDLKGERKESLECLQKAVQYEHTNKKFKADLEAHENKS